MKINESTTDRIIRVILGAVLLILGWTGVVTGTLGAIFKWLGFIPLLTGLIGFCPLYAIFKMGTKK